MFPGKTLATYNHFLLLILFLRIIANFEDLSCYMFSTMPIGSAVAQCSSLDLKVADEMLIIHTNLTFYFARLQGKGNEQCT